MLLPALLHAGTDDLLDQAEYFIHNYHVDAGYLDSAWSLITQVRADSPENERSLTLAAELEVTEADFAASRSDSLDCYDRARAFAETLKTLDDSNASGHLWYGVAAGAVAEIKGILNSVEVIPTLKREFTLALELDPNYPPAYECLGRFYFDLPPELGGSTGRAVDYYRSGLEIAPDYTLLRLELARALVRQKQPKDAAAQLDTLLATGEPWPPADFALHDRPEAEALLARLKARE
jgi:tetratricopeptide (TPR) repeat protein